MAACEQFPLPGAHAHPQQVERVPEAVGALQRFAGSSGLPRGRQGPGPSALGCWALACRLLSRLLTSQKHLVSSPRLVPSYLSWLSLNSFSFQKLSRTPLLGPGLPTPHLLPECSHAATSMPCDSWGGQGQALSPGVWLAAGGHGGQVCPMTNGVSGPFLSRHSSSPPPPARRAWGTLLSVLTGEGSSPCCWQFHPERPLTPAWPDSCGLISRAIPRLLIVPHWYFSSLLRGGGAGGRGVVWTRAEVSTLELEEAGSPEGNVPGGKGWR